ncbi:MAG: FAD-dependent monooxygenase [Proteobacteria bacterium]|nr:FAD-dependent monooxygenase [Pseudomonadota bacterium]
MLKVPVLIVGGGGAGLTASMTLSSLGVDHLLVSAFPGTSILPKAHVLNQRAMEIFTEVGVADAIYERSTPAENMRATGWYAGMAGDHEAYGRTLGHLEAWGAGYTDPDYIAASACRTCNLPQIRLEPLLRAHAEQRNPGKVRFHHELTALEDGADGVTATILDKDRNERFQVKARYLLAADGGRTVGKMVGVGMSGPRDIMKMVSVHMTADLSPWLHDDDVLIRWLVNPAYGGSFASGVLVSMGPDHWGTKSEEWVFHMKYATDSADAMKDEKVLERMRTTLGVKDLEATVHKISTWVMEGVIADRFRKGNIFFVGDAAHRHPPTGGLGLTSAVHDVYNLCWKLSLVLAGKAGDGLLDTYEAERKPVDQANIDCSIGNAMNHFKIDQALNLSEDKTQEQNWAELLPLWDESLPRSAEKRHALNAAIASQTMEFHHHNVEFGYRYHSTAVIDDSSPAYVPLDPIRLYEPSTKPGHPLPHAFVEMQGERVALASLVGSGQFLVIAGEEGGAWVQAARQLAQAKGLPIKAFTLGLADSDYIDVRMAWLKNRAISPKGVVIVRPDRYIAFRSLGESADPRSTLTQAFQSILSAP